MKLRSAELLKKYDIKLKKSLGQNLLLDANINRKMAEAAQVGPTDSIVEVGAGIGDLTEVLAERAREVLTVEIDRSFEPALRERFGDNPRVNLLFGDILNQPVKELTDRFLPSAQTLKMVSNLPFYITSPLLMHFLESEAHFVSLTVIVQKEVAGRIVATPGGKDYGILSIACQLYTRPSIVHFVSPKCFRPKPKVYSAILHLATRDTLPLSSRERTLFFEIVRAAFGQRRKKVINALAGCEGSLFADKDQILSLLRQSGISPDARAETISIDNFIRLAQLTINSLALPQ